MANTTHQKQRLLIVLRMLRAETDAERGLTMPQIIERLAAEGVAAERKAIYRDLDALRAEGFDVRKLPTRPVQYALVRSELGLGDVMMLVDVVQASPFLSERRSSRLVRSLKSLVSDREQQSLAKRVHVQGRIRNQNDSVFHNVDRIHEAMRLRRKIEFLYFSYGPDLKRRPRRDGRLYVVTPVKVVYADSNYYLVAFDEMANVANAPGASGEGVANVPNVANAPNVPNAPGAMRTYRIDRMQIAQISNERATRNETIANYGLDEFDYLSFGMFSGQAKTVTLRADASVIDAVVDRFGLGIDVVKSCDAYADVRVNVQVSPQFFGWLAGLDGTVTIRAPKSLSDEYRTWLQGLVPPR